MITWKLGETFTNRYKSFVSSSVFNNQKKIAKTDYWEYHSKAIKCNFNNNSLIIEAGSNDGSFLNEVKKLSSAKILGVDPSKNISKIANKKKINTYVGYFNL